MLFPMKTIQKIFRQALAGVFLRPYTDSVGY